MSGRGEMVALVILKSPAGPPHDTELIAKTLARHLPEPAAIAAVQAELATGGLRSIRPWEFHFPLKGPPASFIGTSGSRRFNPLTACGRLARALSFPWTDCQPRQGNWSAPSSLNRRQN